MPTKFDIVNHARYNARQWIYNGEDKPDNHRRIRMCTHDHYATGSRLIYTRDAGHHSGGWWKNPDYERCFHLSISYRDPSTGKTVPHSHKLSKQWCKLFFGHHINWLWIEPPNYEQGIQRGVWHFRLFCDEGWQPIKPRKEVYTTAFTEAGWKSFSEMNWQT